MELDLSKLSLSKPKPLSIILVGHVDAGKSTICGRILVDLRLIDQRSLEKYREKAAEMNRSSWWLSWYMDTNPEERQKGTTTEVGTASFDYNSLRISMLDCPGHKQYITSMLNATYRADVGVLVVSARGDEFEKGFVGGQTREHLILLMVSCKKHLVVLINKMDECGWSQKRYNEVVEKVSKFVKKMFPSVFFIPINGLNGENLVKRHKTPFYSGPSLMEYLETVDVPEAAGGPCLTITEKIREPGVVLFYAKCNAGLFNKETQYMILPLEKSTRISEIATDMDIETDTAEPGLSYKIKLDSFAEEVAIGMKLVVSGDSSYRTCSVLYAKLNVLEVKSAFTIGYSPVMHIEMQEVACKVVEIVSMEKKRIRVARKGTKVVVRIKLESPVVVLDSKTDKSRFSLRDESLTVAVGALIKVVE